MLQNIYKNVKESPLEEVKEINDITRKYQISPKTGQKYIAKIANLDKRNDMMKTQIRDFRQETRKELKLLKEGNGILIQRNVYMSLEITLIKMTYSESPMLCICSRCCYTGKDKKQLNDVINSVQKMGNTV